MPHATNQQKSERLNLAWALLRQRRRPGQIVQQLVDSCAISPRQACRYLQQARHLRHPAPISDPKVAFTVKLSRTLVGHLRAHAKQSGRSLSECVSHALTGALLARGRGRG